MGEAVSADSLGAVRGTLPEELLQTWHRSSGTIGQDGAGGVDH